MTTKKEMAKTIAAALFQKLPENLPDDNWKFKSLMKQPNIELEGEGGYDTALRIVNRIRATGHKDSEIIICQCGFRASQGEFYKNITDPKTQPVTCPNCHLSTLRYQTPQERIMESFVKSLDSTIESCKESEAEFAEKFLKTPWHELEWAHQEFEITAKHYVALKIRYWIDMDKASIADMIKQTEKEVLHHTMYPRESTSVTSNLSHRCEGAAYARMLEDLKALQSELNSASSEN